MPELPDVQVQKEYLDATSLHQRISQVQVQAGYILKNFAAQDLKDALHHRCFERTRRHGKFLFVRLDKPQWMMLHFGMTGRLVYEKPAREEPPPQFSQLIFSFDNNYRLSLVMPRKLGEVRLLEDVDGYIQSRDLGPDVMAEDFTFARFRKLLEGRRGMLKSTLMNQRIMAGIGNVYSDEILFQAHLHPRMKVSALEQDGLRKLYDCMQTVLETAIQCRAVPNDFPDSYLTPLRGQEGAACPRCSGKIERIEVSGRGAYFCPTCQEKTNDH